MFWIILKSIKIIVLNKFEKICDYFIVGIEKL